MGWAGGRCCEVFAGSLRRWALRRGRLALGPESAIVVDDISAPTASGRPASMVPNTAGLSTPRLLRVRPEGLGSMFLRAYVELHLPITQGEGALPRTPAARKPR